MNILKKIIPYNFKRKVKEQLGVPSFHWSLQNLKKNNFNPSFILDIGAYEGYWAIDVLEVFPDAKILMVEAQKNKENFLKEITKKYPNTNYAISLLSSADGIEKLFREDETASHIISAAEKDQPHYVLKGQSLDSLLLERKLPSPDFMKLDVQGHEMEVLKGATNALSHTEVCLLEISLLDLGGNNPLLSEMVSFMNEKDFQAYDISHFIRRPFDKALYQVDMFFVKKGSPLVTSKRWA